MGHGSPGTARGMVGAKDGVSGLSVENPHCTLRLRGWAFGSVTQQGV